MNKTVTSKNEIMNSCLAIVKEEGIEKVNMRKVANKCNIALGSLYNYFPDKNALLTETITSVWSDIFQLQPPVKGTSFLTYVEELFAHTHRGIQSYANFFTTHSLRFTSGNKCEAHHYMHAALNLIKENMKLSLSYDPNIKKHCFNETFTEEDVVNLVYDQLMASIMFKEDHTQSLIEVLRRILY